ncbi:MAG: hypothetical protein U1E96_02585 [Azonexus sp.]
MPPRPPGVEANGTAVADPGTAAPVRFAATEGVLSLTLYGHDADGDRLDWQAAGLPRGMVLNPAADGSRITLALDPWTTWPPARWQHRHAGPCASHRHCWRRCGELHRTVEIAVANVNQTPRLMPLPLHRINEGETLAFTVRAADLDGDALRLSLLHDATTPAGVSFDASPAATSNGPWINGGRQRYRQQPGLHLHLPGQRRHRHHHQTAQVRV